MIKCIASSLICGPLVKMSHIRHDMILDACKYIYSKCLIILNISFKYKDLNIT